jgi:hypothetical protein
VACTARHAEWSHHRRNIYRRTCVNILVTFHWLHPTGRDVQPLLAYKGAAVSFGIKKKREIFSLILKGGGEIFKFSIPEVQLKSTHKYLCV